MLKKAGILVAVAAAGALAVAPLAFAGEKGGDWGHENGHDGGASASSTCTFDNDVDNSGNEQKAAGIVAPLLGALGGAANVNAPVTPQTNGELGSCNNFSDLVDVDVHDNVQDNSER